MTTMPLSTLLAGFVESAPDIKVSGLTLDNRKIQPGMVFVAVRGTRQHGLDHAEAAVRAGAVAVLYEPENGLQQPPLSVELVPVPSLREHLGTLADRFNSSPSASLFMVGVTGTDGKTSVSHFVAEAMNAAGAPASAVIGTLGIGLPGALKPATHTTPDALTVHALLRELREEGFSSVAMEVSSHALDQGRVNGVRFDVAVLTNLTRDHLDYHGTVEAYAEAKRRLFHWPDLKAAVLNLDDPFGCRLAEELREKPVRLIGYGVGDPGAYPPDTLVAVDPVFDHAGISATVVAGQHRGQLSAPVLGRFNLHNLLAALGVLLAAGMDFSDALQRLQRVQVVPGRMERVTASDATGQLVVVDYAHTPGALEQVLQAVRVHTRGRLLCVFGCGGDRDRGKRPLMAQKAESGADVVIITDDNPRSEDSQQIFEDIMQGITNKKGVTCEHDRSRAIRLAISQAQPGDTVLIAGKGHEAVQILANGVTPFDDRVQAMQALRECAA
ncbi:UDP-N-acetylmuramoyl-L-alanyl-D-glutamate--2,6-diaminopimelate ligase [Candidatus Thiothrix sp. Deng01]|uniref:UDP-N-acetylmuramoyl-L-alanyl-D-glutamate--2,6-diaminopimelate ligase n=1 Tax=Candidatus Thiothrix phosphatis TaxID=3112415 RepID=A0ABU6D165_9GAMM|nr:UDP-N-acetylmuramoyl-L-alanyl-D-glutamate--2,6-diaminopimelate ligase [Candidatus Thiothrix sp. Deng01]MEB4592102.1 UDP-N-acetylmuramoyl-L-alanyl-D-glutamate--2,6-diaminopimelate ligase [Candidatus Thiothrix sp. Deng01]